MKLEEFVERGIAAQKAVDKIIDAEKNKKDDAHHCCGRYIRNKADRERHDELFHTGRVVKVSYNP